MYLTSLYSVRSPSNAVSLFLLACACISEIASNSLIEFFIDTSLTASITAFMFFVIRSLYIKKCMRQTAIHKKMYFLFKV